jgi:hypothetical protein
MSIEDLIYGLSELEEARPDYEKAEQYYKGTQHDIFGNTRLEQKLKAESKLYRVNLAKTAVNVVADRLTVAAVTVPDDEAATALIADVWADNELDLHQDAFTRRACEYGDSYALCGRRWTTPRRTASLSRRLAWRSPSMTRCVCACSTIPSTRARSCTASSGGR